MVVKDWKIYTKECKARDLPKDQFPHQYMKFITGDNLEKVVKYVYRDDNTRQSKNAGREAHKILNRNYILTQLGLTTPILYKRGIFYYVVDELKGKVDMKGTTQKAQYTNMENSVINVYLKKLYNTLRKEDPDRFSYWGFVQDYINVKSNPTVGIYKPIINSETGVLDRELLIDETLKTIDKTPFYLLVGEKISVIEPVGLELVNRGYDIGYIIIDLGGNPVTDHIKALIKTSKIKNFHVFVLHDGDLDGLEILFDQTRHNNVESVGINPEFLYCCGIKAKDVRVEYLNEKEREKSYTGANTILEKIKDKILEELYEKYKQWIEFSSNNKIELNSIMKLREEEDINSCVVRDFCDYIEYKIEKSIWNLLRIGEFKKEAYTEKRVYDFDIHDYIMENVIEYTTRTELKRLDTYEPRIIGDVYYKKDDSIILENEELNDQIDEIKDILEKNYNLLNEKLTNIIENEESNLYNRKEGILNEFKEDNPELFDIDWDSLFDKKKIDASNREIKKLEKIIRLRNTKKYMTLRNSLMNYIGSIKNPKPVQVIYGKRSGLINYINQENGKGLRRFFKLRDFIFKSVKRTKEYKKAKEIIDYFEEFTDSIDDTSKKALRILDNLKEKLEKTFKEVLDDLNELESNDENIEDRGGLKFDRNVNIE